MAEPLRLLIVCLGNICRSPMAEGLIRDRIKAASLADRVEVDSVGTGDWHVGAPPDHRAIATAAGHGVDIARLCARQLSAADYQRYDWLLCADRANLLEVRARMPADSRAQAALLLGWGGVQADADVPDPYTGDSAHFEQVWQLLDRAADGVVARLHQELSTR